ncbi:putative mitochondrial hypothetical protein [Leptomonas pyrrhocoris]|uniref:Uncharacterized protein n=1 Tax=Leptomonas pyrrhocoris TaxID=157538 RepID=A0A0N0VI13_LEPPY|nr:putative mitochondrial hypothetical protein [Leptomonas pyrrhocoris]XP_015665061.1 putative mitochondrial hypothetical protein [Leptomonas pyrrhocoris]KPA86621.1 putative mitochondrial hypothetical protein [Leptomonas pyrrhocoris]KPA86622.1 putative mitochondrial hypothetical protein [Leptomonas pyrrhocoris]|eukprot:XP_015665060.1 putative mitochondrial hypothetical protein [Leptomonas pyrrhocoris]
MLDYLIPIAIAVVGIVVMVYIFQSINKSEVSAVSAESTRKPRAKKSQHPSHKYREDVLDIATEQLIAREVARAPTGMVTDTKTVAPTTLDSIRSRRNAKEESQHTVATAKLSERQKQVVKDQGFTVVEKQKPAAKHQQQQKQQREQEPTTSTEDLEKKLSLFFKSSGSRKARESKPKAEENSSEPASTRGTVTMKGNIGVAKGWPFKEAAAEQEAQL